MAQSGIWLLSFVVSRFDLSSLVIRRNKLQVELQSHCNSFGRKKPWETSGSQRFDVKEVAKHNHALQNTHGSTCIHWYKCCRIYPLHGRNHSKYGKYLSEDGITHKETLFFCYVSDFEGVFYLIKHRRQQYLQLYDSPDLHYMPISEWVNSCPGLTNDIDWTSSQ